MYQPLEKTCNKPAPLAEVFHQETSTTEGNNRETKCLCMTYSLVIDNKQTIPCHEQPEVDVLYTATTLSKYGGCSVEVYQQKRLVCRYEKGRAVERINVA